ncbi:IPExxxVDY family protein [Tenacibaculum retecalamus]|uniref:IPExxxVDY family protein n=1 Tax=Tenacibaculum retecalamus TaxID=3018315 RepID=UPI0023D90A02|nr:IPExxxVDY family protein [Tenacibaculum retecalamus]WBX71426.1 IPExxxVDY family protein [Tenacibaculum retecalamus]
MTSYTLNINEFATNDYALIGIHTVLDECKLAYLLNKYLHVKFRKANYDLDFTQKNHQSFYSVYEYVDITLDCDWFLITNVYKSTRKTVSTSLFNESDSITRLVPEKKKVDFFLKITGDFNFEYIVKTIEKINKIPQIITSYEVEVESLKSKDFLIF